jgi:hypothetical protein
MAGLIFGFACPFNAPLDLFAAPMMQTQLSHGSTSSAKRRNLAKGVNIKQMDDYYPGSLGFNYFERRTQW